MNRTAPLLLAALLLLAPAALAGGGPETTLVVVNSRSPLSRIVAAEYVRLRDIPLMNVVHLDEVHHSGVVTLEFYKTKIWGPIAAHMEERGIADSIDLITYSADFPYGVDFRKALGGQNPGNQVGGTASLTGTTYLIRHVLAGDPYWSVPVQPGQAAINRYFRLDLRPRGAAVRAPTAEEVALSNRAMAALTARRLEESVEAFGLLVRTWKAPDVQYNYACALALLGRSEEALDALSEAVALGFQNEAHAAQDGDLESLRVMPRFQNILESMKEILVPFLPARGFRSAFAWNAAGEPDPTEIGDSKSRYYLSTQLAYTGFKGNSLPEILAYLRAAASADGTKPDGTVYICRNGDVRSRAREPFFAPLVRALGRLGRKVEILDAGKDGQNGVLPVGKDDVIGAVIGSAGVRWQSGKSRILPGAIVEHLTSFGAHFGTGSQTKLTEFMRYGAAGSSGTVVEPLAIHAKFPNPMIHAFYAEGCSLAEAFYQSIGGPYQLMVVGDGLCRPFAEFIPVRAEAPAAPWSGEVEIEAKGRGESFELFVDGRPTASGRKMKLDTTTLDDGWHDVRVVAVAGGLVGTRSSTSLDAFVVNGRQQPEFSVKADVVDQGQDLEVTCPGAKSVALFDGDRRIGGGKGDSMAVSTADLGPGRVTLLPFATFGEGPDYRGKPITIEVRPALLSPRKAGDALRLPGLRGRAERAGEWTPIALSYLGDRFRGKPLRDRPDMKDAKVIELTGQFEAPAEGLFQIVLSGTGTVTLTIDGETLATDLPLDLERYLPARLAAGWHDISIRLVPKGRADFSILLAGETELIPVSFRHGDRKSVDAAAAIAGAEPGKPIPVPAAGVEVAFERTVAGLAAVVLRPAPGAESFPVEWTVESSSAARGRTSPVKDAKILVCAGAHDVPEYVQISFEATRARRLVIRPVGVAEGVAVQLSDIVPLGKER